MKDRWGLSIEQDGLPMRSPDIRRAPGCLAGGQGLRRCQRFFQDQLLKRVQHVVVVARSVVLVAGRLSPLDRGA